MLNIAVFTSTRADYGILSPLIKVIDQEKNFELRLFVTGTHLIKSHGLTVKEIEGDGFKPFYQVEINMTDDKNIGNLNSIGESICKFSKVLSENKPDLAIVLGDRFEALAFAIACNGLGIELAHIHGGEVTQGALDDSYRHCITKLSYLHFVATDKYKNRVLQMGEAPARVHNVGALAVDNIRKIQMLTKDELSRELGAQFRKNIIVVTYHPETANPDRDKVQIASLFKVLEKKIMNGETSVVFTRANADHGNENIHQAIEKFTQAHNECCLYVSSLGMKRYLSLLKCANVVVGNSSSGVIEAPVVGTPSVNIGDRQRGREMPLSVISVAGSEEELAQGLDKALKMSGADFKGAADFFGDGNSAAKIINVLKTTVVSVFPKKEFCDVLGKI